MKIFIITVLLLFGVVFISKIITCILERKTKEMQKEIEEITAELKGLNR